jgi:hypothetical protein
VIVNEFAVRFWIAPLALFPELTKPAIATRSPDLGVGPETDEKS